MVREDKVIAFDKVRYCYGEVCAVFRASFDIKTHTLTALVGPNGGGKSTVIKLLTGVLKPEEGKIKISQGTRIGYVPQTAAFDASFPITVFQVVLSGTLESRFKPFATYSKKQKEKATKAIAEVGLTGKEARGINQLSGGQIERTMIARALASDADIIVLDEPDSSLDVDAAAELYNILNRLKKKKTILVASHRLDKIIAIADSALYIDRFVTPYSDLSVLANKFQTGVML